MPSSSFFGRPQSARRPSLVLPDGRPWLPARAHSSPPEGSARERTRGIERDRCVDGSRHVCGTRDPSRSGTARPVRWSSGARCGRPARSLLDAACGRSQDQAADSLLIWIWQGPRTDCNLVHRWTRLPPSLPAPLSFRMSKKSSKQQAAAASSPDGDIDMTNEETDMVPEFIPSTVIGSYLSQNYNPEVENKKVPGFICGRQSNERDPCEGAACAARSGLTACALLLLLSPLLRMLLRERAEGAREHSMPAVRLSHHVQGAIATTSVAHAQTAPRPSARRCWEESSHAVSLVLFSRPGSDGVQRAISILSLSHSITVSRSFVSNMQTTIHCSINCRAALWKF